MSLFVRKAGNMLVQLAYPEVQAVYASPMIRCTQTAGILFPGKNAEYY